MSGGFANPLVGGDGKLVFPQIQSPNFVHGASGWRIGKDGSAEFQDVILPAGTSMVATFAAAAPASPHAGDLWYDTANGLQVSQWDGAAWVPYSIGTGAIAAGAVTAAQIAAAAGITSGQVAFTARAIGGITTTIAATAPGSPVAGDIWMDTTTGYKLKRWSGSVWSGVIWAATDVIAAGTITAAAIAAGTITATQIAAGTITAAQLAAGIVYAGIVDATTVHAATFTGSVFEGTDFIINSAGSFLYSGTPASGNLILAIANAAGSDQYGNAYKQGLMVLGTGASAGAYVWLDPALGRVVVQSVLTGFQAICDGGSLTMSTPGSIAHPATYATQDAPLASIIESPSDGTHGAAEMKLYAGTASAGPYISSPFAVALNPSTGAAETWHVPSLTGGWSQASGMTVQYTLLPVGLLALAGRVQAGTVTAGTIVMTLPAGYYPATGTISIQCRNVSGNGTVNFTLNTSGQLQYQSGAAAGDTIDLDTVKPISMTN